MSTPYVTTRHRCDHCRRSYASSTACRRHEASCYRNPATRSCPTCLHFQPTAFTDCAFGFGDYHGDDGRFEWQQECPSWEAKP